MTSSLDTFATAPQSDRSNSRVEPGGQAGDDASEQVADGACISEQAVAGRPRQIVPLDGAAAEEWWQRQATSAGLVLHTVTSTPIASARGQHRGTSGRINHACTRFDGTATVTDAKSLREAMLSGIGRGKSYGCGLLSIAP
ncbi:type I-E CRISPR-associated protein Cas6/Cse3/CasE [Streptosporangium sp. NPDC002607]